MEYSDSFYYFSMENLNIPSFSELHEKSLENTIYTPSSRTSIASTSTYNNYESNISSPISSNTSIHSNCTYQQGMLSPTFYNNNHPPPYYNNTCSSDTSSNSSSPIPQTMLPFTPLPPSELGYQDQFQFHPTYQSCFPSPVNSTIDYEHSIPSLPHTVKSHDIHQMNYSTKNEVILTSINDKKRKTLSKKQKKLNELPYAPNLLNLQLVSTYPSSSTSSSSSNQYNHPIIKKTKKINSSNLPITNHPSSSSSIKKPTKSPSAYKCDFPNCEKTFTRPYNLKSHRRTHTAERPFICPLCPKSFARQHDRNRHAKLHLGIKPYICTFCEKSFARQDALNRHQRVDDSAGPSCARTSCRKKKKSLST